MNAAKSRPKRIRPVDPPRSANRWRGDDCSRPHSPNRWCRRGRDRPAADLMVIGSQGQGIFPISRSLHAGIVRSSGAEPDVPQGTRRSRAGLRGSSPGRPGKGQTKLDDRRRPKAGRTCAARTGSASRGWPGGRHSWTTQGEGGLRRVFPARTHNSGLCHTLTTRNSEISPTRTAGNFFPSELRS
jgi:hypothetical protein